MSKDYKPRSAPKSRGGSPMLTGILIGVFIGLAVAIAVAFYVPSLTKGYRQPEAAPALPAATPAKPPAKAATAAADASENKKPRFDFYNILPGTEEPVTEQQAKEAPPAGSKEQYYLQAGAFPNEADADNLKARLALMGIEATVQSANVPDKGVWHRVRVGPFASIDEMGKTRTTLAQSGIQATLIKVKQASQAAR
jgi:cell division protein FtsN